MVRQFLGKISANFSNLKKNVLESMKFTKIHNWLTFQVIWAVILEFIAFFQYLLSIFPIYFLFLGIYISIDHKIRTTQPIFMIFSPKAHTDAIYDKIIHFDLTYIVLAAEGVRKGYWHPVYR